MHVCVYVCVYVWCVHMCVSMRVWCVCVCACVCVCVCMCGVYTCVNACVCMCVCVLVGGGGYPYVMCVYNDIASSVQRQNCQTALQTPQQSQPKYLSLSPGFVPIESLLTLVWLCTHRCSLIKNIAVHSLYPSLPAQCELRVKSLSLEFESGV